MGAVLGRRQLHFEAVCKALDVGEHVLFVVRFGQHSGRGEDVDALALRLGRAVERGAGLGADHLAFLVHYILCASF